MKILIAAILLALMSIAHAGAQCTGTKLTWTPINTASSGLATLVPGVPGKKIYICKLYALTAGASNLGIVEGTGTNCGTAVSAGVIGGPSAATGINLPANGYINLPADATPWGQTATAGDNLCINPSAATQLSGVVVTSQQ